MKRLRWWLASGALLIASMPFSAGAQNVFGTAQVVVGHIDTGVKSSHQEFNYLGKASTTDQFEAWWDFTDEVKPSIVNPAPGQLWDTAVINPYDNNGHGTATASLAVGRNIAGPGLKDPSFAPGYKLAVAKVGNGDGTIPGDIPAAIRWLVDTAKADVITISIGVIVPIPAVLDSVDEATAYARDAGVLVLYANGNGYGGFGLVPGDPGWASPYAGSTHALAVGADALNSFIQSFDPEVVAKYASHKAASRTCNTCYTNPNATAGTSFGTPLVAGMAARLMATAIANGKSSAPVHIETILKYGARDRLEVPPTFEGYGILDAAQLPSALNHAKLGTLPATPTANQAYVENVSGTERDLWTNKLDEGLRYTLVDTGQAAPSNKKVIGASLPEGLAEGEVYTVTLPAKSKLTVTMGYAPPDPNGIADIDLLVFKGTGPVYAGTSLAGASFNGAGVSESVTVDSPGGGTYSIVVLGWSVVLDQTITLSASKTITYHHDGFFAYASAQGALG